VKGKKLAFRDVKNPIDIPALEKEILAFWEKNGIFEKSVESRPKEKPFIFYEGPPTANGKPGIHHVISRSIKDFVCRYQTMKGFRVERKAGWDTHGLPVEIEVEKELGFQSKAEIEAYGVDRFNRKCRESVFRYVKEWNELTRRMGYWVDIENPYITYNNEYIESVWWLLAEMWRKDYLYKGFKILTYCPRCETALSSHETSLGYKDVTDVSLTVKFRLLDGENRFILAWTTTPWTLPGNVALAVGEDVDYVEVEQQQDGARETYYIAEGRLEMLQGEYRVVRKLKGKELENWRYEPLFDFVNLADEAHKAYYVALADFVTTEEGTGVVHTAVMYGEDDYRLGLRINLPARHTVNEQGLFNEQVPLWKGRYVKDPETEKAIILYLRGKGLLYRKQPYTHSYPHCWRCDAPLLYYAKKSWYIKTTAVGDQLIRNNQSIQWYPREVGEGRFGKWLENNVDWALSRERYWGTPLNVWICESCGKQEAVESIEKLKSRAGISTIEDLHKPTIDGIVLPCPDCASAMKRTPEVLDCWFDSGAMPYAQFHHPFSRDGRFESHFPADFIAEGVDQTRGWFYSLLAISTLVSGIPSYKSCISIEMILDKEGQKMSKSRGNAADPFKIMNRDGADVLRWYLYTVSPPWVPTRFDEEGVREVLRKFFGTLTNTYSFFVLYANVDGFTYRETAIPADERSEIDRWLISMRNRMVQRVNAFLSRYDLTKAARQIQDFVIDDLSNWYVRRNRRRFWKSEMGQDKLSAYQTLFETLFTLSKLIAPFTPFIAEEMFRNLNVHGREDCESVHLSFYPDPEKPEYTYRDEGLEQRMEDAREVVSLCRSARNEAGIKVRQPLEKAVIVGPDSKRIEAVQAFEPLLREEVNIRHFVFQSDSSGLSEKQAKPIFKKLGPKFGAHVNQVAEIIAGFSSLEISRLEAGEKIRISVNKTKHGEIARDDIEVQEKAAPGLQIQKGQEWTVAIDTHLTEELVAEGLAREFINRIQNMRKDAGFEVTDRIRVHFEASSVLHRAVRMRESHIREEVLAVSLEDRFQPGVYHKEWDIDQEKVKIGIERIA